MLHTFVCLFFSLVLRASGSLLVDADMTDGLPDGWVSNGCVFTNVGLSLPASRSGCAVELSLVSELVSSGSFFASMQLSAVPRRSSVWMAVSEEGFDLSTSGVPSSAALAGGWATVEGAYGLKAVVYDSQSKPVSTIQAPDLASAFVVVLNGVMVLSSLNDFSLSFVTGTLNTATLIEGKLAVHVPLTPRRLTISLLRGQDGEIAHVLRFRLATTLAEVLPTGQAVVPPPPTTTTIGGGTTAPASACDDLDCATCQLASASKCVWCAHVDYPAGYCTLNRCGISFARATSCATKAPPTTSAAAAVEAPSPGAAADWTPTIIGAAVGGGLFVISVIILAVAWRRGTRSGAHQTTEVATPQERQVGMYGSMASLRSADSYGQLSVAGSSNDPTPTVAQYGSPYGVGGVSSVSSYGALNVN